MQGGKLAGGNPENGRVENDFYATDPVAVDMLFAALKENGRFVLTDYFAESEELEKEYFRNLKQLKEEQGLSGNELLCYSLIYGFTQDKETEFRGSLNYVASALNVTKQNAKKIIQAVLNEGIVNDVVTAGTLAQYYLEILRSIKIELTLNSYDPHKNKQYILGKALQELHYCDCVMRKTGEKIIEEKIKDYMEALKEYRE